MTSGPPDGGAFAADVEHHPMSGLDEFLIHNHPNPVRVMWTSDPRAYERMWFTCQDDTGDLLVVAGMGVYPNLGTAEAFAIVNHRGRHTTVRAHRKLGLNRMDMTVGPLAFEVVTPFREWRLSLGDNDHGIAFDLSWIDTKRPVFRNIGAGSIIGTRPFAGVAGYDGFGRQSGWVEVDGVRHEVTSAHHCGTRDHHWGTRDGVGGRALWGGHQHPHSGEWVEFAEYGIWGDHVLYNLGDPRRGSDTLRDRRYRLRFEPETRLLVSGEVDYVFADGHERTVAFERLGHQIAFLRCAMYGGPNGGTPDGDLWQGTEVGDGVVTGESYDVSDAGVRTRICGLDQHHARFVSEGETVYGIVEPYDTLCYELARAGRGGFSLLE